MKEINLEERVEKAKKLFKEGGYNCCQAVVLAYNDVFGIDDRTAAAISSGFGGGMGRMREVCGAVSGMVLIANMLYGNDDIADKDAKDAHYARIRDLLKPFETQNGSIICRELLGLDENGEPSHVSEARTAKYYQQRPCAELVADAADILEKYCSR